MRSLIAAMVLAPATTAQQMLWQVVDPSYLGPQVIGLAPEFGDLDQDGALDLLAIYVDTRTNFPTARVYSGATGAILDDDPYPALAFHDLQGVGDFDLDGYPDFVSSWDNANLNTMYAEVWSPHRSQSLLRLTGTFNVVEFARLVAGRVDLDGDGLPDLLIGCRSEIRAYRHNGSLLYTVPLAAMGRSPLALRGMEDLDGDGCNEILVGGTDSNSAGGFIQVLSGRTGAQLRITFDQTPGDRIGYPLASAGDMDRDGFVDYVTGNYYGNGNGRLLLTVYSGATGSVLRQWDVPNYGASTVVGGHDIDLDGVVDVIAGSRTYDWQNNLTGRVGRVGAFSSRDQQLLLHTEPDSMVDSGYSYAAPFGLADLGVQPGNPFPVIAVHWFGVGGAFRGRTDVWRLSPVGEQITAVGCSGAGAVPTVGVRRVATLAGEQCRVVLGSAPPSAMALCIAAGASATTYAGQPLPLSFDVLGFPGCFPGCSLLVPPTLVDARTVGTVGLDRGYAGIDVPLQLHAPGFGAAVQWLTFDFTTGAYGATPRCEVLLN